MNETTTAMNITRRRDFIRAPFRPGAATRAWAAFKNWRARRAAIRQLRAMPDSLLRDIGIERHQIVGAVSAVAPRGQSDVVTLTPRARNVDTPPNRQSPQTKKAA